MQKIVGEIFLDDVAAVAAANHKVVHSVRGIHLHDVPQNGASSDFDHGLWFKMGFLGNASSKTTCKYDGFHGFALLRWGGVSRNPILKIVKCVITESPRARLFMNELPKIVAN